MQDIEKDSAVENWLSNLGTSTRKSQIAYFRQFMSWIKQNGREYAKDSPLDLVEKQKENKDYQILDDLVKPYVRSKPGTYNTKKTRYSNIRSFFLHNRSELPKDPTFNLHPEREPVRGTLKADEIKQMVLSSKPRFAAMFMCMFQSAMDQEMFTYWNTHGWDNLHRQLRENPEVIKIQLPGRKKMKNVSPFYTFIGRDAIDKLKNWLKVRREKVRQGKISENCKVIFCNMYGKPVTKRSLPEYWLRHLRQLGLAEPSKPGNRQYRTGKGLHEMRDVFRSLWSKSPASHVVGEYCMGHTIDKLEYDKSFRDEAFYREEYLKASGHLNLFSSYEPFGLVEGGEVRKLQRKVQQLEAEKDNNLADLENTVEELKKMLMDALNSPEALKKAREKLSNNS